MVDLSDDSDGSRPLFRDEVGHADGVKPAFRSVPDKAADRSALNLHLLPPVVNLGVVDASEEEADDATIENFAAPEAWRRRAERPDDRLPDRSGAQHDSGISRASRGGRAVLAAARGPDRRGAGPA